VENSRFGCHLWIHLQLETSCAVGAPLHMKTRFHMEWWQIVKLSLLAIERSEGNLRSVLRFATNIKVMDAPSSWAGIGYTLLINM
jgi:hypothetical protein